MPIFKYSDHQYILTSRKVASSSFDYQRTLKPVTEAYFRKIFCNPFIAKELNLIVRNPYDRLYSAFYDKTKQAVALDDLSQGSQALIYALSKQDQPMRDFLYSLSFQDFVESYLSAVYMKDSHFYPQSRELIIPFFSRWLTRKGISIIRHHALFNCKIRLIRMEDEDQLRAFFELHQLHWIRQNKNDYQEGVHWTNEMRLIVNRLYRSDFLLLGYPMETH